MLRWGAVPIALAFLALPAAALAADPDDDSKDEGYVTFTKDHPRGTVEEGKALLYVVRPTSMGFAVKSFFVIDDAIVGINRGSSYFFTTVEPGKHVFWSKSENVDALEMEVEAGKTYYVQQRVQVGGFRARTKLEVLDVEAGEAALAKCDKHGTITAKGREKGAEIVAEHKKDTLEDLERRAKKAAEGADPAR